jgi:hypothetical protein
MWKRLFCCGATEPRIATIKSLPEVRKKIARKTHIPMSLRAAVWHTYIGESIGKTKCPVCEVNYITPFTFQCGHVIAEACGGATNLDNLRPICMPCNVSSGKRRMDEFKETHFASKK